MSDSASKALVMMSILALACCANQDEGRQAESMSHQKVRQCRGPNEALRAKLIEGIKKIDLGSTRAQVESVLGYADYVEPSASKDGRRSTGVALYYVVKSCGSRPWSGGEDEYLVTFFDADNHLYAVVPENIREVMKRSAVVPRSFTRDSGGGGK